MLSGTAVADDLVVVDASSLTTICAVSSPELLDVVVADADAVDVVAVVDAVAVVVWGLFGVSVTAAFAAGGALLTFSE